MREEGRVGRRLLTASYLSLVRHLSSHILTRDGHEGICWSETILIHWKESSRVTVGGNTELSTASLCAFPTAIA